MSLPNQARVRFIDLGHKALQDPTKNFAALQSAVLARLDAQHLRTDPAEKSLNAVRRCLEKGEVSQATLHLQKLLDNLFAPPAIWKVSAQPAKPEATVAEVKLV